MILFLLTLACFLNASAFGASVCDEAKFDAVAGDLMFYANTATRPEGKEELLEACVQENRTLDWLETYSKECIRGIAGGVMRLLLDSAGQEIYERCYGGMQDEYLENIPCLNTVGEDLQQCNIDMTTILESTSNLERTHLLARSCCSIQQYAQCLSERAMKKCSKKTAEYAKGIIFRIGENILEGPCFKFTPESKECKAIPHEAPPEILKYKSFVPAMINVLNKYG